MEKEIQAFTKETQDLLKTAACIGTTFDLVFLADLKKASIEKVYSDLEDAIQERVVTFYSEQNKCSFIHSDLREMLYSQLPHETKQQTHLEVCYLMLEKTPKEEIQNNIFELVKHLNLGKSLLTDQKERDSFANLNLYAGRMSKQEMNYKDAILYYSSGMELIGDPYRTDCYQVAFPLLTEKAECEIKLFHFTQAETYLNRALEVAKTDMERARVHGLRMNLYHAKSLSESSYRQENCSLLSNSADNDTKSSLDWYRKSHEELIIELQESNQALIDSQAALKRTEKRILQMEKMASLGELVSGFAHDINTPIGVSVMAASFLEVRTKEFEKIVESKQIRLSDLFGYIESVKDSIEPIQQNLRQSSELIQNFKQVAVDRSSKKKRSFLLKNYLDGIILSLRPRLRKTKHNITLDCSEFLKVESYPGIFSQVITNLVMNSLIHAFEGIDKGNMSLSVIRKEKDIVLTYKDDGIGIGKEGLKKIFIPFYTTREGQGGSGLGMHIVKTVVQQTLQGSVECLSEPGRGFTCIITMPNVIANPEEIDNLI